MIWTAAFRGPRTQFWPRMTLGVGALGLLALLAQPELRRERPRWRDPAVGLGSAAALYGIFQVGDRAARLILPAGAREIDAIYQLRTAAPRPLIAVALATAIGPGEELFWRGLVQRNLQPRFGRLGAALVASGIYGGIHVVSENLTLTAAAGVAGLFWSLLYACEQRLPGLIISHVAWDIWIFLIAPTVRVEERLSIRQIRNRGARGN
jgi:membrane protease YdiL (CAAX protease family)